MNTNSKALLTVSVLVLFTIMLSVPQNISAGSDQITVIPINSEISIKKTVTTMDIPQENTLPWGVVSGTSSNHVGTYPAIIQIYQGDSPIHFAQVDVSEDGSYEYVFRIRNIDSVTGEAVNIFQGVYTVVIYTVVSSNSAI